jgi:predicted dehydrogenase
MTSPTLDAVKEAVREAVPPMPKEPLPIVIIGSGGIVRDAHLPAYRRASFPVAAVVDIQLEKAAALAADFSIPLALNSIDEAIRVTPAKRVFDVAVPAGAIAGILRQLPQGSAVLIQKPMGNNLDEAKEIVAICREKQLTAAVNFQLRYAPVMLAAKKITDANLLGELHDMEIRVSEFMPWDLWSFLATSPRLEILYHSIHYIDLVRSWFGNPERVLAKTVRNPHTPKLAPTKSVIVMDYGEWKRVFITANHNHTFQGSQTSYAQWEGTQGALHAVMGVNLDYPKGKPDTLSYARPGEEWSQLPTQGNWFPDAFIGSMGSLQARVTGASSVLPTSVEDALDTMKVVEAAYLSSERDGVDPQGLG